MGCKKAPDRECLKSAGEVVVETRPLGNFNHIVIKDNIELNLTQSTKTKVDISAGKNLLNFIKTEVKNDTLYISNENKCNILRSYKNKIVANLSFIKLDYLKTTSTENITSTNTINIPDTMTFECKFYNGEINLDLTGKYFAGIVHSGGGSITAKGNLEQTYSYHVGTGSINYLNLNAKKTHIHSRTGANCYINASSEMIVEIHSSGNIYYNSNFTPSIRIKKYGNGQLFPY